MFSITSNGIFGIHPNLSIFIATTCQARILPGMSTDEIIGLLVTLLAMGVALLGAVLPVIPGPTLVLVAALAHRLWFTDRSAPWWVIIVLTIVTGLVTLIDFLASTYGARRMGATWRGMAGAGIGAVIGLFWIPPAGLLIGPLVGASLGELLGGRDLHEAGRAGLGAALGVLAGAVAKLAACLGMIGIWLFSVLMRPQ